CIKTTRQHCTGSSGRYHMMLRRSCSCNDVRTSVKPYCTTT
ncbi:MAG: hypothetical protein AVDCRST_MAG93-1583, partial [uncultured Chloroflexia bacterium]